jgi:DNA processing protein
MAAPPLADGEPAGGYEDAIARLRLIRTSGIGPVTYAQLSTRFGSAAAALAAVPDLARRGGGRPPVIASRPDAEREMAAVARLGARHLFRGDAGYPTLLAEIDSAPPALIVAGKAGLLDRPAVAMVGARNASAAAVRFARQLAYDLAEAGLVVVSGLARGIDTAAHHGALERGTIAVVAGGSDIYYPPENEALQRRIAGDGLLVAEQPPGIEPKARHFPYRNRIIAGLSLATVVVEAAPRSGSLISARFAAEFGREVLAVPGSPLDPRAQGCNQLIRDGATLIQSAADVLESLNPFGARPLAEPSARYEAPPASADASERDRAAIAALLGPTAVPVDEIIRQSGLAPAIVQTVLLELELGGRLERHAGGRVSLIG